MVEHVRVTDNVMHLRLWAGAMNSFINFSMNAIGLFRALDICVNHPRQITTPIIQLMEFQ